MRCDRNLFISPYHLTVVVTQKDYDKILKRLKVPKHLWCTYVNSGAEATVSEYENKSKGRRICIIGVLEEVALDTTIDPNGIIGLLTHEATHVEQKIMRFIGEREPSDEFEAYVMQALTQEIVASYSEAMNKLRKERGVDSLGKPVNLMKKVTKRK